MIPYDGIGYGKSQYWEYKAKEIAGEQDEGCKHLEHHLPKVTIKYDSKPNDDFYLRFRVKCPKCRQRFYTTEIKLRDKFMEFYGMKYLSDKGISQSALADL